MGGLPADRLEFTEREVPGMRLNPSPWAQCSSCKVRTPREFELTTHHCGGTFYACPDTTRDYEPLYAMFPVLRPQTVAHGSPQRVNDESAEAEIKPNE